MIEKIKKEVWDWLMIFVDKYKFPAQIFIDIYKVEEEENKIKVFVRIDPKFQFAYPVITPSDFIILLQKFVPQPAVILENKEVYLYFVLGEVKEAQMEKELPPVEFQAEVLKRAIDKIAEPVLETGVPDFILGWVAAKYLARTISDILNPDIPTVSEELRYEYVAPVSPRFK